jgi:SpoVK/Ycf46/Vps4 family AAA+-type ATPase
VNTYAQPEETAQRVTLWSKSLHAAVGLDGADDARATGRAPNTAALFSGPSGTGKTLAAHWLAASLGRDVMRIDLGRIVSEYIGETEKNLGAVFRDAERSGAVLVLDEADALFGKRTDVKDSNDRFANQQTNYLLQRIESYDGIALLTSNSRSRFDSAFTRRLDVILEFIAPGPGERRSLWLAHLGEAHTLSPAELNRLAAACDLAGGHIRNITLAARAIEARGPIGMQAILMALASEYRKLGKQMPAGLTAA